MSVTMPQNVWNVVLQFVIKVEATRVTDVKKIWIGAPSRDNFGFDWPCSG